MLKKKLYLNYTNLILEKTKVCIFYVNSFFDKRTSQTHTMMLLSFKSYIQIFPIANLKLLQNHIVIFENCPMCAANDNLNCASIDSSNRCASILIII